MKNGDMRLTMYGFLLVVFSACGTPETKEPGTPNAMDAEAQRAPNDIATSDSTNTDTEIAQDTALFDALDGESATDTTQVSDIGDDAGASDSGSLDSMAPGEDSPGGLSREADPVVVLGAQLLTLQSYQVGEIVAFARKGDAWSQIPVQVDERVVQDFCEVYGKSSGLWSASPACKTSKVITALFYADDTTFTGSDTEPKLDSDDELVFMARDAGDRIGEWSEPDGVLAGSGIELELKDGEERAYVYLFARDGEVLSPGAGQQYVTYNFVLAGGVDYKTGYDLYGYSCGGDDATCNPSMLEDSSVQGASYTRHFSARWVTDELRLTAGSATGVDILDIHQNRFGPTSCGRHVLTYATAAGAYIVKKSGPVRALRSYLGANSGPLTQRDHAFYDRREDITTHLRVHPLSIGVMDVFDYSEDAIGMVYYNDLNPGGLTIDGVPDDANQDGLHQWEYVTGPQGTLVMTGLLDTSLNIDFAHFFWADDQSPSFNQCATSTNINAPDNSALGTSGAWLDGALDGTDPKNGSSDHIMVKRMTYYEAPDITQETALALVADAQTPIEVYARAIGAEGASETICGDGECAGVEADSCPLDCIPVDLSCGDSLCLPPENSVSCAADCPASSDGEIICGDGVCDSSVENKLSCAADCWPPYANAVACVETHCEGLLDTCSDEPGCVDLIACVGPCVAGGTAAAECITTCSQSLASSGIDVETAQQMLQCGNSNDCF